MRDRTGHQIDSQRDMGGWPVLATGTSPVDTDHDGMPDAWERSHGLNPARDDSGSDANHDGYTALEEYLNGLASA
ncbi:MAG: hypothetical protein EOP67_12930 [Sphingomonas sp.]|nr:MAG: hypothetical protein EOP67_12930 [Sphingomonas sp.]